MEDPESTSGWSAAVVPAQPARKLRRDISKGMSELAAKKIVYKLTKRYRCSQWLGYTCANQKLIATVPNEFWDPPFCLGIYCPSSNIAVQGLFDGHESDLAESA